MPAPFRESRGPGALRGALAGRKRPPLALVARPAGAIRRGSPVHALQDRIRGAFAIDAGVESGPPTPLERAMRQARAIHRANVEGVRTAILSGEIAPAAAARWITADAETCIGAMLEAVLDDLDERQGPGLGGVAVLGMGKLGARELSLSSDIDLIFVCDAGGDEGACAAGRLQAAAEMAASALAWRAEGGSLYEVDVRLRPFGADGPLATPFSLFTRYYARERWLWELQALTRARVIGADSAFGRRIEAAVAESLQSAPPAAVVLKEVAEMRRLMAREHPPAGPWDLKRAPGGVVDLEFIIQALQLSNAAAAPQALRPTTEEALTALRRAGALSGEDAAVLDGAWRLFSAVRQLQGAAGLCGQDLKLAPPARHEAILAGLGAVDWASARARLEATRLDVRRLFRKVFHNGGAACRVA